MERGRDEPSVSGGDGLRMYKTLCLEIFLQLPWISLMDPTLGLKESTFVEEISFFNETFG